MNLLELAGFVTGVVAVALTARQVIWCWPLGIVNVAIYAVVFYEARLYADMGLQVVYAVLCAYGWWCWSRGEGDTRSALTVRRLDGDLAAALLLGGVFASGGLGFLLDRTTNAALPWFDAGTAVFSLIAQWMQAKKLLENWLLWILVDVVYIGMYVNKELWLTAILYLLFLGLAGIGWASWRQTMAAGVATTRLELG